jgi:hypothetical protein
MQHIGRRTALQSRRGGRQMEWCRNWERGRDARPCGRDGRAPCDTGKRETFFVFRHFFLDNDFREFIMTNDS